ncbi:hypothetical protein SGODD07_00113 [Streptococcus gordonii]|uniref:Uncharacterized protein n=1 Tax=Streptococcus gordonii TaxID=1302 RepID=A0A139NFS3_STRGN|nr:hypothetical protein SGODD07_00113 [Streptococcus gordonii]
MYNLFRKNQNSLGEKTMISIHILIAMLLILAAVLVPVIYFKKSKHISLVVFF